MYVHVLCALSKPVLITESGNEIVCFPPYQWVKPHPLLKIYRLGQDKTVFIFPHRFLRDTLCLKAAPKVMPPVLLCWSMTSEADVGGMTVEAEPFCQCSITFCCHVTEDSKGAVWQNGIWRGSAYETKGCHWIPPWGKNGTQWYSFTLTEYLERENSGCKHSGCKHSEAAGQWVVCFSSDNSNSGSPLQVHIFTSAARRLLFISGKST